MMPHLRHGEWLLVPKIEGWAHLVGWGSYRRGDIVVFKPPRDADYEWTKAYRGMNLPWAYRPYLVKRIVGLPGDRVEMRSGQLWVNGQAVSEPATINYWAKYCHDTDSQLANSVAVSPKQTGRSSVTVPEGHYFVMGDNRSFGGSLDSRSFGPVDRSDIAGRALASVLPLARPQEAHPDCGSSAKPQDHVQFSGDWQWNPRWLKAEHR